MVRTCNIVVPNQKELQILEAVFTALPADDRVEFSSSFLFVVTCHTDSKTNIRVFLPVK